MPKPFKHPSYFYAPKTQEFNKNYDAIFRKKDRKDNKKARQSPSQGQAGS